MNGFQASFQEVQGHGIQTSPEIKAGLIDFINELRLPGYCSCQNVTVTPHILGGTVNNKIDTEVAGC